MIKVIYKPNLLEGKELSCFLQVDTVQEAILKMADLYPDFAKILEISGESCFIISVNDLEIPKDAYNVYPIYENDEVIISHDVGIPLAITAIIGAISVALKFITFTAFLVQMAISIAIYAINYFTRPDPPKTMGMMNDFTSTSPTYSWSGIVTTYDVDRPIPVIYGKHRVGGNVINHFITTDGEKNYWNVLLALGHGPIGGIWRAGGDGLCESNREIIENPNSNQLSQSGLYDWKASRLVDDKISEKAFHTNNSSNGSFFMIDLGAGNAKAYIGAKLYAEASESLWQRVYNPPLLGGSDYYWKLKQPEQQIPNAKSNQTIWDVKYSDNGSTWIKVGTIGPCIEGLTTESRWGNVGSHRYWKFIITNGPKQSDAYISELQMLTSFNDIPDILVNGNPFVNYKNIEWDYRLGTLDQTPIAGFNATHTVFPISNVKITKDGYKYSTSDVIEGIEIKLSCLAGLWKMDSMGNINENSVKYNIQFKPFGAPESEWMDEGDYKVTEKSKTSIHRTYFRAGLNGRYDFKITRVSPEETGFDASSDIYLTMVDEIVYEKLSYPGIALVAFRMLATEYLQGELPNFQILMNGLNIMVPKLTYDGAIVEYDKTYWDPSIEKYKYAQWDNKGKWLSDIGDCIENDSWIAQTTKNPIWNTTDFITSRRYGNGEYINLEAVDIARHSLEAKYCYELVKKDGVLNEYEHRFEMDGVIDGQSNSIDIMAQICSTFNAYPVWVEGTYKILIDRPKLPTQMYTMGNIIKDSFKWAFYPLSQRPNSFTASFLDRENEYTRDNRQIVDSLVYQNNLPIRSHNIHLPLVTRESQILRIIKHLLNCSKYRKQLIEFSGGIDSIQLQAGDTFYFSHDVNHWNVGGRILDINGNQITLDRPVTIEPDNIYKITVRLPDPNKPGKEMFESQIVTNNPGTYEVITIQNSFSVTPIPWETVYIFGLQLEVTKEFLTLYAGFDEKRQVSIKAVETNNAIWEDSAVTLISTQTKPKPDVFLMPKDVTDLMVEETANRPGIRISYNKPENDPVWFRTEILLSLDAIHYFTINPGFKGTEFEYFDIIPGKEYFIKVISFSKFNIPSPNPPIASITVVGVMSYIPNVRGLELFGQGNDTEWRNRDAKFAWRPIALRSGAGIQDADVEALNAGEGYPDEFWQSYYIEIWDINNNKVREEYIKDPYYVYTHEKNIEDNGIASNTITIKVWNYSIFNILSYKPATLTVTNSVPAPLPGLSSKPVGGGVEFTWYPSSAIDHDYYEIRTAVGTGGWGSWIKVQDCYYYRELTASEILNYGNTPEIYIQVRDVDTFGQSSAYVATNKLSGYVWGELLAGKISSPDGRTYFDLEWPEIHCENIVTGDYSVLRSGFLKFFKYGSTVPYWYTRRIKTGVASDNTYITLNWDLIPKVSVAIKEIQSWKSDEPGDQYVECFAEEIDNVGFRVKCRLRSLAGSTYIDDNVTMWSNGTFQNNPNIEEPTQESTKTIKIEQEIFDSTYWGKRINISGKGEPPQYVTERYRVTITYKLYYKLHSSGEWIYVGQFNKSLSTLIGWKWTNTIFDNQTAGRYDFKIEYISFEKGVYVDTISGDYDGWRGQFGQTGYYIDTGGTIIYQGSVLYMALEGGGSSN